MIHDQLPARFNGTQWVVPCTCGATFTWKRRDSAEFLWSQHQRLSEVRAVLDEADEKQD